MKSEQGIGNRIYFFCCFFLLLLLLPLCALLLLLMSFFFHHLLKESRQRIGTRKNVLPQEKNHYNRVPSRLLWHPPILERSPHGNPAQLLNNISRHFLKSLSLSPVYVSLCVNCELLSFSLFRHANPLFALFTLSLLTWRLLSRHVSWGVRHLVVSCVCTYLRVKWVPLLLCHDTP